MNSKNPLIYKILALVFSILFIPALIISFFSIPLELVFFDKLSYEPIFEESIEPRQYQGITSRLLISRLYQSYPSGQIPPVLSDQESIEDAVIDFVPEEWSSESMENFFYYTLDFLSFRITESILRLDIQPLKSGLIENRFAIAREYLSGLPNCTADQIPRMESDLEIIDLPECKPGGNMFGEFVNVLGFHLEDLFNRLPSEVSITSMVPPYQEAGSEFLYYYSIARWSIRLLPLLTVAFLIVISLLLRRNRLLMLKWVGWLSASVSGMSLIALIVLLIGFNQFVTLVVNRFLEGLVPGFDAILLSLLQEVGTRTLIWVSISAFSVFVFGVVLIFIARLSKPKKGKIEEKEEILPSEGEEIPEKEFKPETPEEIERREIEEDENDS